MDATFYDDLRPARGSPLKRPMTLDLGNGSSPKKHTPSLLTSPDLNMLKLASPELEKIIMAQHQGPPGPCMYQKGLDDREQPFGHRDFTDALSSLQHGNNLYQPDMGMGMPPCSTAMVDASYGYGHQQQQQHHHQQQQHSHQQPLSSINLNCNSLSFGFMEPLVSIKEEPQTVPCGMGPSPPQSPIDMEEQERLKLERKRLRNRIAASKCRRRKLERIARLEDKVTNLKNENTELTNHVTRLRECVCQLKEQVMNHVRSGCEMMVSSYATDI